MKPISNTISFFMICFISLVITWSPTRPFSGKAWGVTSQDGFNPDLNSIIRCMVQQPDGKLLIGGDFHTICGETRNNMARVTNTDGPFQSLTLYNEGTTIAWSTRGDLPRIDRISFDTSADGAAWSFLGNGMYLDGLWLINDISLPVRSNHFIRVQGYITGGKYNGSNSLIESTFMVYNTSGRALVPPILLLLLN